MKQPTWLTALGLMLLCWMLLGIAPGAGGYVPQLTKEEQ